MRVKRYFASSMALLLATVLLQAPVAFAQDDYVKQADNFIVLFDTSNTMTEVDPAAEGPKLIRAKDALLEINRQIPDLGFTAGIYNFTPWEPVVEMGPYNRQQFEKAIGVLGTRPTHIVQNPTPLGTAMDNLGDVLSRVGGRTVVFLFSDGQNTDPVDAVAEAYRVDARHEVCFLIIGYPDEDKPRRRERLERIAAVNECSRIIEFEQFIAQPGLCTGALCTIPTTAVAAAAPGDDDGDGVPNDQDRCPGTPQGYAVDEEGCMIPVMMDERMIHFQFDKTFIEDQFKDEINAFGRFMEDHPNATLILGGHTDSIGTQEYNVGLSRRRATSVAEYVTENFDVDPARIDRSWYGEAYPIAPNDTAAGRRENRRVEMLVQGAYRR
jgi:OOP family OmpA-OmpF porin